MSLKTKIARYAATQKAGLPVQVETIILQIGLTDFPRSDVSAILCKPDFTAWHLMTKKRIIYTIIFPEAIGDEVPRRSQMLYLKSSTPTAMLSDMGIDGCVCPDCSGMGTRINKTDVDQFIEKCKRCAGIGFIENPSDEIRIQKLAKPPAPVEKPKPEPKKPISPETKQEPPETKPGTRGQISNFLQGVKRGFMPASRDLINKKCAGKDVTKDTLIEAIIDAFIDAILDAEEKG